MARALVLIILIFFFSEVLSRKSRRSRKAMSPYINSLDSMLSAEEVSVELGKCEIHHGRRAKTAERIPCPAHRTGAIPH